MNILCVVSPKLVWFIQKYYSYQKQYLLLSIMSLDICDYKSATSAFQRWNETMRTREWQSAYFFSAAFHSSVSLRKLLFAVPDFPSLP